MMYSFSGQVIGSPYVCGNHVYPPRRYATFPASFPYRSLPENQFCRIPVSRAHHPWTRLPAHRKRTWRNLHRYQMEYLRYRASLHPTAIRQASRRFSNQIYIYLFAAIRFVIGRPDKLSSLSLARRLVHSICDIAFGKKKKKKRKGGKETVNRYITFVRNISVRGK